jgi:hypothetical protein
MRKLVKVICGYIVGMRYIHIFFLTFSLMGDGQAQEDGKIAIHARFPIHPRHKAQR